MLVVQFCKLALSSLEQFRKTDRLAAGRRRAGGDLSATCKSRSKRGQWSYIRRSQASQASFVKCSDLGWSIQVGD